METKLCFEPSFKQRRGIDGLNGMSLRQLVTWCLILAGVGRAYPLHQDGEFSPLAEEMPLETPIGSDMNQRLIGNGLVPETGVRYQFDSNRDERGSYSDTAADSDGHVPFQKLSNIKNGEVQPFVIRSVPTSMYSARGTFPIVRSVGQPTDSHEQIREVQDTKSHENGGLDSKDDGHFDFDSAVQSDGQLSYGRVSREGDNSLRFNDDQSLHDWRLRADAGNVEVGGSYIDGRRLLFPNEYQPSAGQQLLSDWTGPMRSFEVGNNEPGETLRLQRRRGEAELLDPSLEYLVLQDGAGEARSRVKRRRTGDCCGMRRQEEEEDQPWSVDLMQAAHKERPKRSDVQLPLHQNKLQGPMARMDTPYETTTNIPRHFSAFHPYLNEWKLRSDPKRQFESKRQVELEAEGDEPGSEDDRGDGVSYVLLNAPQPHHDQKIKRQDTGQETLEDEEAEEELLMGPEAPHVRRSASWWKKEKSGGARESDDGGGQLVDAQTAIAKCEHVHKTEAAKKRGSVEAREADDAEHASESVDVNERFAPEEDAESKQSEDKTRSTSDDKTSSSSQELSDSQKSEDSSASDHSSNDDSIRQMKSSKDEKPGAASDESALEDIHSLMNPAPGAAREHSDLVSDEDSESGLDSDHAPVEFEQDVARRDQDLERRSAVGEREEQQSQEVTPQPLPKPEYENSVLDKNVPTQIKTIVDSVLSGQKTSGLGKLQVKRHSSPSASAATLSVVLPEEGRVDIYHKHHEDSGGEPSPFVSVSMRETSGDRGRQYVSRKSTRGLPNEPTFHRSVDEGYNDPDLVVEFSNGGGDSEDEESFETNDAGRSRDLSADEINLQSQSMVGLRNAGSDKNSDKNDENSKRENSQMNSDSEMLGKLAEDSLERQRTDVKSVSRQSLLSRIRRRRSHHHPRNFDGGSFDGGGSETGVARRSDFQAFVE